MARFTHRDNRLFRFRKTLFLSKILFSSRDSSKDQRQLLFPRPQRRCLLGTAGHGHVSNSVQLSTSATSPLILFGSSSSKALYLREGPRTHYYQATHSSLNYRRYVYCWRQFLNSLFKLLFGDQVTFCRRTRYYSLRCLSY